MSDIIKSEVKKLEQEFVSEFRLGINGIIKASNILIRLIEAALVLGRMMLAGQAMEEMIKNKAV